MTRRYINGYYSVTPHPAAQKRVALMYGSFHYAGLDCLRTNGCSEEMHQGNAPGKCTLESLNAQQNSSSVPALMTVLLHPSGRRIKDQVILSSQAL